MAEKVVENQDIIEIGNNIQKIRKKNGISQSVLAEKIDVAGNSIYRMEGATTVMGVDKLINIADALNTSPMDILPARFQRERISLTQEKAEQLQIWNDLNEGNRNIVLTMMRMLLTEQQKRYRRDPESSDEGRSETNGNTNRDSGGNTRNNINTGNKRY